MATSISFLNGNNLETITFDTATVRPMFDGEITESPIEKGAPAADNQRDKPDAVTIECLLTDYPLSLHGGGIGVAHEKGRASDILSQLLLLKSKGVQFGISSSLRQYSHMLIRSITPNTDKMVGAVRLVITFSKVLIVASQTVNVTVAANRSGQKKTDKGKQTGKEAPAAPLKSKLADIVDSDLVKSARDLAGSVIP